MMTSTQVKFKVNRAGSSSLNLQDLLLNLLLAGPEAEAGDNQFLNLHAPPCCICMFESFLLLREPHLFKNSFCCSIESSFCKLCKRRNSSDRPCSNTIRKAFSNHCMSQTIKAIC
ncbi:uncharacterized protein LOC126624988 isoform X1 [Malus sylvestris]|uniref:uncharacterized protein LOC126624988 isoform X1 n=1 Tax=Malus sylvestris TaxID=3752 RepID=UPI0007ECE4D4|nr:uncharacterized protein LOC126624988 isoform X1 [Malus sylvestris]